MDPLVSVIITNYNHARYLKQRLDTVFNQTYNNYEVIILDDCSTDNSLDIINEYRGDIHLSQIVINSINSGSTFEQWEKGIQLAKGDLIWIAESDDYNELIFIEEMVNAFAHDPLVVVAFSSYISSNEYGGINKQKERSSQYFDGTQFVRSWMSMCCAIKNASGAIFKKEAYNQISKEYISFRGTGDRQFWTEIASKGKVAYIRKNLTYNRICSNSVTSNNMRTGNAILEDARVCRYILDNYHLSWFQKQAMNAMYSHKCRQINLTDDTFIRLNELWHINKRNRWLDYLYLKTIGFIRRYFGILI